MNAYFGQSIVVAFATLLTAACSQTDWPVVRELCGRIQISEGQSQTVLKSMELVLNRSRSKSIRCCAEADRIANIQTNADGDFSSGRLDAGRYFLAVEKSPQIVFPVYLETDYDGGKCSLNTMFSLDQNTGKTEQTVTIHVRKQS